MKSLLQQHICVALDALRDRGEFDLDAMGEIPMERSRGGEHGDFASPVALSLARSLKR